MAESVYFITALVKANEVRERLASLIAEENQYELAGDKWMVVYDGPTQELAEKVGVRSGEGTIGNGLVLAVTTYSGRAPTTLWDWLREKGR